MPSNECLLLRHYSGLHLLCHSIFNDRIYIYTHELNNYNSKWTTFHQTNIFAILIAFCKQRLIQVDTKVLRSLIHIKRNGKYHRIKPILLTERALLEGICVCSLLWRKVYRTGNYKSSFSQNARIFQSHTYISLAQFAFPHIHALPLYKSYPTSLVPWQIHRPDKALYSVTFCLGWCQHGQNLIKYVDYSELIAKIYRAHQTHGNLAGGVNWQESHRTCLGTEYFYYFSQFPFSYSIIDFTVFFISRAHRLYEDKHNLDLFFSILFFIFRILCYKSSGTNSWSTYGVVPSSLLLVISHFYFSHLFRKRQQIFFNRCDKVICMQFDCIAHFQATVLLVTYCLTVDQVLSTKLKVEWEKWPGSWVG